MNTKLNKVAVEKMTKISFNDFKILFDYFAQAIKKEGYTKDFSLLCVDNFIALSKKAQEVQQKINDHFRPTEKMTEFNNKINEVISKYADRTEEGKIIFDDKKHPVITEQIVEYSEEEKKLMETYKDEIEKYNETQRTGNEFLSNTFVDVTLTLFNDIAAYPEAIVPIVYAVICQL
jgi:predicted small metal-binding protein